MPTSQPPANVNEPSEPPKKKRAAGLVGLGLTDYTANPQPPAASGEPELPIVSGSRWIDYNTHELLEMISDLEDERRWARLREGFWIAILLHLALISALTWIPRYVFKVPPVVDPFSAINQRKDLTYLDLPPDALRQIQPKTAVKTVPQKPVVVDKKTLDDMKKMNPPAPEPEPKPAETALPPTPATIPPNPQSQSQLEAPRPAAVPARPNFAMNSSNPADQLRDAMRGASRNRGASGEGTPGSHGLARHPGAGSGGIQVLSDTQGVDFSSWLQRWHHETENTWDPLIPDEVNAPINKSGVVAIRFKVLPNGRLMDGSLILEGRSGDTALDRAAWGALTGSNYPPLPREFHGPYLELRAFFFYNIDPNQGHDH